MPLLTVEDSFDFHLPILSMVRGPGQQQNCHGEKKKKKENSRCHIIIKQFLPHCNLSACITTENIEYFIDLTVERLEFAPNLD